MAASAQLEFIAPRGGHTHTHTIILLHGRDSNASEFAKDFLESQASDDRTFPEIFPGIKWVFPTSKIRKSERFQGINMSQWFDMWTTEAPEEREELQVEGLNDSVSSILDLVRVEAAYVEPHCIFLGGISQGCATAIHVLFQLKNEQHLGGFIGLCSWLPFEQRVSEIIAAQSNTALALQGIRELLQPSVEGTQNFVSKTPIQTPVFLAHSRGDPIIHIKNGEKLCRALNGLEMSVEWHPYDNEEHWLTEPQGVDDIVAFLNRVVDAHRNSNSSPIR